MNRKIAAKCGVLWALVACGMACAAGSEEMDSVTGGFGAAGGAFATGGAGGALPTGGVGGALPTGGVGGPPVAGASGMMATGGAGGVAGNLPTGGVSGMATGGMMATGGVGGDMATGGTGGPVLMGECCEGGDCLCHGPEPTALTADAGPFQTAMFTMPLGTVYYPTDAEPPFATIAICPGFLNSGPEMAPWGPFYASHGFVLVQTNTTGADFPDIRAGKLLAALEQVKLENAKSGGPLFEKLSDRYGTSGYSMGGGGTTLASADDPTLKTSIGLAAWGGVGTGVTVPTLLLCGQSDTTAACSMSSGAYTGIPEATPKMMIAIPGATHFNWFGPTDAGMGRSGMYALAFQKVFLDGDERWRDLLLTVPATGMMTTNIN